MYRTLAYSKCLRRLPDCGIAVDDVIGNVYGALLDIFLHDVPLRMFFTSYEGVFRDMRGKAAQREFPRPISRPISDCPAPLGSHPIHF